MGADQAVVNHDVSLVQGAAGLQGQQVGITGASADKSDMSGAGGFVEMSGQKLIQRPAGAVFAVGLRFEIIGAPEITAGTAKGQRIGQFAQGFPDAGHHAQACGQLRLEVRFEGAGKHGGRPFGADGDGDGITVHNGGRDKGAVGEVVHDVDQCALRAGNVGGVGVCCGVFVSGIEQGGPGDVAGCKGAAVQGEFARRVPGSDFWRGVGGKDVQSGL